MIDQIREWAYQPKGIKAFGWGVLGFLGTNVIINIVTTITVVLATEFNSAVIVMPGMLVALAFGAVFATTRRYEATSTGCWISIVLQIVSGIAALAA